MPKTLFQPTATVEILLREAQHDGLCVICGGPPATSPLVLVPLCQEHSVSLIWYLANGFGGPGNR